MKTITLTKNQEALVSDESYDDIVGMGSWYAHKGRKTWYAARTHRDPVTGKQSKLYMHRAVLGVTDPEIEVYHWNFNGLDCRIENLVLGGHWQMNSHARVPSNNTSGYKGVVWSASRQKWQAIIKVNGKNKFLGYFDDPIEAAHVRDAAAVLYHGEFAVLKRIT